MNKARNRNFWTAIEAKYRMRAGKEAEKGFKVFTGYYKNNERI